MLRLSLTHSGRQDLTDIDHYYTLAESSGNHCAVKGPVYIEHGFAVRVLLVLSVCYLI